jgi:hypothetical protein
MAKQTSKAGKLPASAEDDPLHANREASGCFHGDALRGRTGLSRCSRTGSQIHQKKMASLLHLLDGLGWKYVARLKSNRYFEGEAVRERWPHRYGRTVGRVRKISHEVCVVTDGRRYVVTNDTRRFPGLN